MGPPVRRFLSNYFDLLLSILVLPRFLILLVLLTGAGPLTVLDMMLVTNAIIQGVRLERTKDHTSSPGGRLTGTGQAGQAS